MRLFIIFILIIVVEFLLRTYVDAYKYHRVGLFLEFLPLVITAIVGGLIFKQRIKFNHFGWTYFKLIGTTISGLIVIKTLLFVQWYWFIAPEYRNVPGDMAAGLGFMIFDLTFGIIVLMVSYLLVMLAIKSLTKKSTGH